MNKSIPLWRDANTLLLEIEKSVRYFPRYHKYTLGAEMRQQAMCICRLINRAFLYKNDKKAKFDAVTQLVMAINDLKLQIQLAKELQVFRNFAEFERLSVLAVQSGKQSGGWLRKLQASQQPEVLHRV